MDIKFNGTTVKKIYYNNKEIRRVFYDDISSNDYYDQRQVFSSGATITLVKDSWFSSYLNVFVKVNNSPVNLPATVKAGDYVSITWQAQTNYSINYTSCSNVLESEWYTSGNPVLQKTRTFTVGSYSSDTTLEISGYAARCLYPDAQYAMISTPRGNVPLLDYAIITHVAPRYSETISGHITVTTNLTTQFGSGDGVQIVDIVCISENAESDNFVRRAADEEITDIKYGESGFVPKTGNWKDDSTNYRCYQYQSRSGGVAYKPSNSTWRFYVAAIDGDWSGGRPKWSDDDKDNILSKPYNHGGSESVLYMDVTIQGTN